MFKALVIEQRKENKDLNNNSKNKKAINYPLDFRYRKILVLLNPILIIYLIFLDLFIECNIRKLKVNYSYVTLKTNYTGVISIFGDYYFYENPPNEIYINDINQSKIDFKYNFNDSNSNIKIIWYKNLEHTREMFYICDKITEIDLSNFDTTLVTEMNCMFQRCSSLTSLILFNINTSQVTNMEYMFEGCSSLTSLDLSFFDTSKVTNMGFMFCGCSSLTSLDLSFFDTSRVTNMESMFYTCSSLVSLNLSNFNTLQVENIYQMVVALH